MNVKHKPVNALNRQQYAALTSAGNKQKPTAIEQANLDAIWHAVSEGKDPFQLGLIA